MLIVKPGSNALTELEPIEEPLPAIGAEEIEPRFRAVVGMTPTEYRRAVGGPPLPIPPCMARAWLRPSRFGEARGAGRA